MDREIELFIREFLKEVREEYAAIFAGEGLSALAGWNVFGTGYLGLYPLVERLPLTDGSGSRLCIVEQAGRGYRFLDSFSRGDSTIRAFPGK